MTSSSLTFPYFFPALYLFLDAHLQTQHSRQRHFWSGTRTIILTDSFILSVTLLLSFPPLFFSTGTLEFDIVDRATLIGIKYHHHHWHFHTRSPPFNFPSIDTYKFDIVERATFDRGQGPWFSLIVSHSLTPFFFVVPLCFSRRTFTNLICSREPLWSGSNTIFIIDIFVL